MDNELMQRDKPLTLLREELLNNIVDLINNGHVPYLLVEPMLENILNQVKRINLKQLELDRANWIKGSETQEEYNNEN